MAVSPTATWRQPADRLAGRAEDRVEEVGRAPTDEPQFWRGAPVPVLRAAAVVAAIVEDITELPAALDLGMRLAVAVVPAR